MHNKPYLNVRALRSIVTDACKNECKDFTWPACHLWFSFCFFWLLGSDIKRLRGECLGKITQDSKQMIELKEPVANKFQAWNTQKLAIYTPSIFFIYKKHDIGNIKSINPMLVISIKNT